MVEVLLVSLLPCLYLLRLKDFSSVPNCQSDSLFPTTLSFVSLFALILWGYLSFHVVSTSRTPPLTVCIWTNSSCFNYTFSVFGNLLLIPSFGLPNPKSTIVWQQLLFTVSPCNALITLGITIADILIVVLFFYCDMERNETSVISVCLLYGLYLYSGFRNYSGPFKFFILYKCYFDKTIGIITKTFM